VAGGARQGWDSFDVLRSLQPEVRARSNLESLRTLDPLKILRHQRHLNEMTDDEDEAHILGLILSRDADATWARA